MQKKLKNISLILLVSMYFIASNGIVLEYASKWYSTGDEVAVALHAGPSKDLPVPTLTERRYLPQTFPLVVPSVALLAHAIIYRAEHPKPVSWVDEVLPFYTTIFTTTLSNRAPPEA